MKRLATLVLALLVMSSGTALAQDTGDFSAGYRFLRTDGVNFGKGWYVDVAGHVTDVVSIVGEVAGTYKSFSETFQGITVEADAKLHTFMGGARLRMLVENMNLAPFGQILFGVGNARASASSGGASFSDSQTDGAMSVSGGVDVNASGALGLRVMAGWLRDFSEGGGNAFTFSIGAGFAF